MTDPLVRAIRIGMTLVLLLPLTAFSGEAGFLPAELPRGPMPPVLLAAPVNATWAANQLPYWQAAGFKGFLFEGILDSLDDERWAPDGAAPPEAFGHPLLEEIRLAQDRLAGGGIPMNFLRLPLLPEGVCFQNRGLRAASVDLFARAGVFCRRTGLRGIAVDTRPASLMYSMRWDGHAPGDSPDALRQAARAFGRDTLRGFIRAYPEGEVLLIAEEAMTAGPRWYSLLEGFAESVGAADTVHIELLVTLAPPEAEPEALAASLEGFRRTLDRALGEIARELWRRQGGVALGLEPLALEQGVAPVLHVNPGSFRLQCCAAKLLSSRYVWVNAPEGGWWHIGEEEAAQYAKLQQGGRAAVRETLTAPDPIWDFVHQRLPAHPYAVQHTLDKFDRVGFYPEAERFIDRGIVLQCQGEIAVAAWKPAAVFVLSNEEGTGASCVIPARPQSVWLTVLHENDRRPILPAAEETSAGIVRVPLPEAPCLLEGLPPIEWAVPASLWMRFPSPPAPGEPGAKIEFGYHHTLPNGFEGMLEIWPPEQCSLGRTEFPVKAGPGESAHFERTVQGRFEAEIPLSFRMSLTPVEGAPVVREFVFSAACKLEWQAWRGAPLVGAPLVMHPGGSGPASILACDGDGLLSAYTAEGLLQWEHVLETPSRLGPLGLSHAGWAAVCDGRGKILCFDKHGKIVREVPPFSEERPVGLAAFDTPESSWLAVGLPSGWVTGIAPESGQTWNCDTAGELAALVSAETDSGDTVLYAWTLRPEPFLLGIDAHGRVLWEQACAVSPGGRPLLAPAHGGVLIAATSAQVERRAARDGVLEGRVALDAAVTAFAEFPHPGGETADLLAGGKNGLSLLSSGGVTHWSVSVLSPAYAAPYPALEGERILAVTPDGALHALDGNGDTLWHDHRAAAPLSGPAWVEDVDGDGLLECLYASLDHTLRMIEAGAAAAPPPRVLKGALPASAAVGR